MAVQHEIEFIITPDGNVELTVKGAKGKQCVPIAELFHVLGHIEADRPSAEFYDREEERNVTVAH